VGDTDFWNLTAQNDENRKIRGEKNLRTAVQGH
jgi:hypothetical protein